MITCDSKNKTSVEIVWCPFLVDATIRRSRALSSQTAAQYCHQSGVHHMCAHVFCSQYRQLERTALVVGAKKTSLLLWSRKKLLCIYLGKKLL